MAEGSSPSAKCHECKIPVGLEHKKAPYYRDHDVFCARHSGLAVADCRVCRVEFVNIGIGACPYCGSHMIREFA